jgi:hypothetical protein
MPSSAAPPLSAAPCAAWSSPQWRSGPAAKSSVANPKELRHFLLDTKVKISLKKEGGYEISHRKLLYISRNFHFANSKETNYRWQLLTPSTYAKINRHRSLIYFFLFNLLIRSYITHVEQGLTVLVDYTYTFILIIDEGGALSAVSRR